MSDKLEYKCNWLKCAHGMAVAGMGTCYAGNCHKSRCKAFETDAQYEARLSALAASTPKDKP